jgi:hypothetical protein
MLHPWQIKLIWYAAVRSVGEGLDATLPRSRSPDARAPLSLDVPRVMCSSSSREKIRYNGYRKDKKEEPWLLGEKEEERKGGKEKERKEKKERKGENERKGKEKKRKEKKGMEKGK